MRQPFWELKFKGGRFEEHAIPLEVLKDLSSLKDILDDIARENFKTTKNRQHLPINFDKNISIALGGIDKDSAILSLLFVAYNSLSAPEFENYTYARDRIIECVRQASEDLPITAISKESLVLFDKFGRTLRENEYIELSSGNENNKAVIYSQKTRESILKKYDTPELLTKDISLKGKFYSVDTDKNTYGFKTIYGENIVSAIKDDFKYEIVDYIKQSLRDVFFFIEGVGVYENNKLKTISEISQINQLDELDISVRLVELSTLKKGWLDGEGEPLSKEFMSWIEKSFEDSYQSTLPLPHLFPMENGGISAEWFKDDRLCKCDIALEINPNHTGMILCSEIGSGKTLNFDADGWKQVSEYIAERSEVCCDEQ